MMMDTINYARGENNILNVYEYYFIIREVIKVYLKLVACAVIKALYFIIVDRILIRVINVPPLINNYRRYNIYEVYSSNNHKPWK